VRGAQADVDNNGTIDYGEFIAATLHLNKVEREDHLFAAFQYFDKDGSGYITADELQVACEEFGLGDVQLEDLIGEVDQDNVRQPPLLLVPSSLLFSSLRLNCSGPAAAGRAHRLQRVRGDDAEADGGGAPEEGRPAEQLQYRVQGGAQDGLDLSVSAPLLPACRCR
jgi:hypothetical protein